MFESLLAAVIPVVASFLGGLLWKLMRKWGVETTRNEREDAERLIEHLVRLGVSSVEQFRKLRGDSKLTRQEALDLRNRVTVSVLTRLGSRGIKEVGKKLGIDKKYIGEYVNEVVDTVVKDMNEKKER